ncbi:MAG TPA: hypothetical protein VNW97_15680 [Candidatus Saccharimonadales bacterium]|nr:hypothetical protein [Candidatus Saccharimonadales bacterium]
MRSQLGRDIEVYAVERAKKRSFTLLYLVSGGTAQRSRKQEQSTAKGAKGAKEKQNL